MGKQFRSQKVGIPQGSVVSTILCNLFYADLEKKKLPFLTDSDGLLLRLIDDFLFISMNQDHAKRFLQYMNDGSGLRYTANCRSPRVWMFCQYDEKSCEFRIQFKRATSS